MSRASQRHKAEFNATDGGVALTATTLTFNGVFPFATPFQVDVYGDVANLSARGVISSGIAALSDVAIAASGYYSGQLEISYTPNGATIEALAGLPSTTVTLSALSVTAGPVAGPVAAGATLTTAGGDNVTPAVITLTGDWLGGEVIEFTSETDIQPQNTTAAPFFNPLNNVSADEMAAEVAAIIDALTGAAATAVASVVTVTAEAPNTAITGLNFFYTDN